MKSCWSHLLVEGVIQQDKIKGSWTNPQVTTSSGYRPMGKADFAVFTNWCLFSWTKVKLIFADLVDTGADSIASACLPTSGAEKE